MDGGWLIRNSQSNSSEIVVLIAIRGVGSGAADALTDIDGAQHSAQFERRADEAK
jgi:hypothetical protein